MNPLIYQITAYLFQYPTEEMVEALPELEREIEQIEGTTIKNTLSQFILDVKKLSFDDWVSHYIHHFDFGKTTNLYVTYLKLGEQRERGLELLKLKMFYEAHGFEITDKELPDYLPLMLEFCANVDEACSNELLSMYEDVILQIRDKLEENGSFYYLLFDVLPLNRAKKEDIAVV